MPTRKTFYIIDGHAQIYRAYYASFRDLTSPTGEPTKGTLVFTQWLLSLAEQHKPDYLAMTIDVGDETAFRREIFPEYKANRSPPPPDFLPQEKRILSIVADAGVPIFFKPGFEADDIIATMVRELRNLDFDIVIVSKDKDLRQLIADGVRLYDPQSDKFTDRATMIAECGYTPEQAIDIQTLMGDAIDNVQGIPGVGEKTAAKLIASYGTVQNILDHLSELTPKLRENFQTYSARLDVARKLVSLRDDVQFGFEISRCEFHGLHIDAIRPHLQTLGFTSLLKRLDGSAAPVPAPVKHLDMGLFGTMDNFVAPVTGQTSSNSEYRIVVTTEQFGEFLAELTKQTRFAFDTETDALGAMNSRVIGMSFSWAAGTGWYVPILGPAGSTHLSADQVLPRLKAILENPKIQKIGHNIKYDILAMKQVGVHIQGVALDTMIAAFVLDSSRMQYGIDRLALDFLQFKKVGTTELIGKGQRQISMVQVDIDRVGKYAAEDADIAWRLAELLEPKLTAVPTLKKLFDEIELPLIDVLVEMEGNGIAVDPAILKQQSFVLGERIDKLREGIFRSANFEFNIDSPKQLADVLFNRLKLPTGKDTKTGHSTDVEVLEKLADKHECPKLILEYRSLVKLKGTYLDSLTDYQNARTGRIHASFNQIGAATGRLSCSDPNLQNIPIRTDEGRRIRMAFIPGDPVHNVLLTADYSQIELRVLAHFTQEAALMRAFENDEDVHKSVAAEVFNVPPELVTREQRNQAKIINFGIIYGVTSYGLSRRIDGLSVPAAAELIAAYNRRFPAIEQFLNKCVEEATSQGYVETLLGRRRAIPEISSHIMSVRNAGGRMAINSVVQGTAADLIKIAMNRVHRRILTEKHPSKMLLQVHDELVFETPANSVEAEAEMVRFEMTHALELRVPLKVEMGWGKNWQEVK